MAAELTQKRVKRIVLPERAQVGAPLTCEEVGAGLLQPDRLLVEFARAAVGPGHEAVPHSLHALFAVRVQEDDNGVPLRVVQRVHGLRSDVQQSVAVLETKGAEPKR